MRQTVVITIVIESCPSGSVLTFINIADTGSRGRFMSYKLINPSNQAVIGAGGPFDDHDTILDGYCLSAQNYQIDIADLSRVAWLLLLLFEQNIVRY